MDIIHRLRGYKGLRMEPEVIQELQSVGVKVYHTGSRAIMETPPVDSDDDWIVLVDPGVVDTLEAFNFQPMGGPNSSGGPNTVPWYDANHKVNIILCYSAETFRKWRDATDEAKRLKLNNRAERIALFKRYRVDEDE